MTFNESVLLQLPGLVFWKDTSSTYAGANRAFIEFAEAPNHKLEGITDLDLPWADYARIYQLGDEQALREGLVRTFVPIFKHGKLFTGLDEKRALTDSTGKVIGVVGLLNIVGVNSLNEADINLLLGQPQQVLINKKNTSQFFRGLSVRETEVLYFFIRGQTMQRISDRLNISIKTVETHLANIKKKWRANDKPDLLAKAIAVGFLHCKPESLL